MRTEDDEESATAAGSAEESNAEAEAEPAKKEEDTSDDDEQPELFDAIEKADIVKVKELIKSGDYDLELRNLKRNHKPLTLAIKSGNPEMVKLLLEEGARPVGFNLWSSFSNKVPASNNVQIAELLLDNGCGLDTGYLSNLTPLIDASRLGATEVARFLLDKGADIESSTDHEVLPMILRWDLDYMTDQSYRGRRCEPFYPGNTPLIEACRYGRLETARLLIERGADIHKGNSIGNTALHTASCSDSLRIYFGCCSEDEATAVLRTNPSIVELLLENGADATKKNDLKMTPLDLVFHHIENTEVYSDIMHEQRQELFNYFTIVSLLVKAGCPVGRVIKDLSEKYRGKKKTAKSPTLQVLTNAYAELTIPSDSEPDSVPLDEGYVKAMKSVVLSGVKPSPGKIYKLRNKIPEEATSEIVKSMFDSFVDMSNSGCNLGLWCQMCFRSCTRRQLREKVSETVFKIPSCIKCCTSPGKDA